MPQGWKIPPHWPFSCSKQETINLLLSKNATNNISAKRTTPQRAQSAHNKRVSPTTWPSSLHAQTNPTRDSCVHPTYDQRPACTLLSGPHKYGPAHTQPSFTSPEARDQPASPNLTVQLSKPRPAPPSLASPHACDQIQRQTTLFNSPSTSSRVQMTHFPDLCPVFDLVENTIPATELSRTGAYLFVPTWTRDPLFQNF